MYNYIYIVNYNIMIIIRYYIYNIYYIDSVNTYPWLGSQIYSISCLFQQSSPRWERYERRVRTAKSISCCKSSRQNDSFRGSTNFKKHKKMMNVGLSYPCRGFDFHNQDFYFLLVLEVVGDPCKPGRGGQPKMNVSLSKNQADQFWLKPIETGWNSCVQRCSVSPFMGAMFLSQTATSSAPGNPPFWVLKWHSFNRKKKKTGESVNQAFVCLINVPGSDM